MANKDIESFLDKKTRKWVRGFLNEAFSVRPQTTSQFVQFTNPERTQGVLPDGTKVTTIATGKSFYGGHGYNTSGNTWVVNAQDMPLQTNFASGDDVYVLYQPAAQFIVKKGTDDTEYLVDSAYNSYSGKFANKGKNLLFWKLVSTSVSPVPIDIVVEWAVISNFSLSSGSVSGSVSTGTIAIPAANFPAPPDPTISLPPAGTTGPTNPSTLVGDFTYSITGKLSITSGFTVRILGKITNNKKTLTQGNYKAPLGIPFNAIAINSHLYRFSADNQSNITIIDDSTNNGTWVWNPTSPGSTVFNPLGNQAAPGGGGVSWGILQGAYFEGKSGTTASVFGQFAPFGYSPTELPIDLTVLTQESLPPVSSAFTDKEYITASNNPFDSSAVKGYDSEVFLAFTSSDHISRYTKNIMTGLYSQKKYSISSSPGSALDWVVT